VNLNLSPLFPPYIVLGCLSDQASYELTQLSLSFWKTKVLKQDKKEQGIAVFYSGQRKRLKRQKHFLGKWVTHFLKG
jgi:hypothetical protein